MFDKKTLELNASVNKVKTCLEGQLNKRRPTGKIGEGKFSLYKCLGSKDQGGFFYFQISGECSGDKEGTRISYRVLPDLCTCLILLCIGIAMISSVAGLLGGKDTGDLVLLVLAVNVIMWAYSLWGMKDLGEKFEERLRQTEKKAKMSKE